MPQRLEEFNIEKDSITRLTELCTFGRTRKVNSYIELGLVEIKDIFESCF